MSPGPDSHVHTRFPGCGTGWGLWGSGWVGGPKSVSGPRSRLSPNKVSPSLRGCHCAELLRLQCQGRCHGQAWLLQAEQGSHLGTSGTHTGLPHLWASVTGMSTKSVSLCELCAPVSLCACVSQCICVRLCACVSQCACVSVILCEPLCLGEAVCLCEPVCMCEPV